MKKNLYFKDQVRRDNMLKNTILSFFLSFVSYWRLLIEVFIRKNFGERYFLLASMITVTCILALVPVVPGMIFRRLPQDDSFLLHYLTWYLFLAAFVYFGLKRHREIKRNPSVFDFAKYSLYSGDINPFFYTVNVPGRKTDIRLIETFLEPLPFFIAGIFLIFLQQQVGVLLTVCSTFYSLSYVALYVDGDNYVMDKIDEMILNEGLKKAFLDDEATNEETKGFRFVGRKPADPDMRRKLLSSITGEEEIVEAL